MDIGCGWSRGIIDSDLDIIEYKLHKKAKAFKKKFDQLYLKIVVITGCFRSNPPSAQPALDGYNLEAAAVIHKFMEFLTELREGILKQQVLGKLSALEPDHMWREECYYLLKISELAFGFPRPDGDPGQPRV